MQTIEELYLHDALKIVIAITNAIIVTVWCRTSTGLTEVKDGFTSSRISGENCDYNYVYNKHYCHIVLL